MNSTPLFMFPAGPWGGFTAPPRAGLLEIIIKGDENMKKRLSAWFLALALCLGLVVPAFAADSDFVIENGVLSEYNGPGSEADNYGPGENIVIPNGVTEIGEFVFRACNASSITIPNGVTTIGSRAFAYSSISSLIIPSSVTQIGPAAFEHCDYLTTVTIPGSITTITDGMFVLCYGLTSVTICDGVTEIGGNAFFSCENLTCVTIPSSVTTIGEQAFCYCKSLTNITIPSSVTTIGAEAFGECDSLTIYGKQGSYAEQYAKANGIPFVAGAAPKFTDVPAGAFYADAVNWAVEQDITNGTGGTSFSPGRDCTHAQILTFLYRAARGEGTADAGDMDKAISWAREKGMIGADFNSSAPCTRADAVNYIWQAFGRESAAASGFNDVPAGAGYAAAVDWAVANGITDGTGNGNFSPDKVCNRGTIVTFLHRAYVPEARLP